jgi:hypothetical protein
MKHKKIFFQLNEEEQELAQATTESVWALETKDGSYLIDNIPFFTHQASLGDVVDVTSINGKAYFSSLIQPSSNSLLRVILLNAQEAEHLRSKLSDLGCSSEQSHLRSLFSVNVPPETSITEVRSILEDGVHRGLWDYEEAILRCPN